MWAMMASPLLVSTNIKNMSDTKREVSLHFKTLHCYICILQILMNQEIISVDQDTLGKYIYLICVFISNNQGKLVRELVDGTVVK